MPAFVNSNVSSLFGTNELEVTTSWSFELKKSKNNDLILLVFIFVH